MHRAIQYIAICTFLLWSSSSNGQCPFPMNLQQKGDISFTFPKQCMTSVHDQTYDYLYVAAKESGLHVYDVSQVNPSLSAQIVVDSLFGLDVMNLHMDGNYLFLALGNHLGTNKQQAGLAIVDVSSPWSPQLKGKWVYPNSNSGAGIVLTSGNYAYLGAMTQGLVVVDITNKSNIQYVSTIKPDLLFPVNNPDTPKYNLRGMDIKGNYLYTCFDAGGVRIIDVSDKQNPKEVGKYSLPLLNMRPRAYNNIIINYPLAYVAIDYCGLEILDISDTANITQVGWWNDWQCENTAVNTWFNSPGHTNEIEHSPECDVVFLSAGKSELCVVNVKDPANPFLCDSFGSVNNQQGTWGIHKYNDRLYLSYIFVPLGIPFFSNWSGIKTLSWNYLACINGSVTGRHKNTPTIYPNPSTGSFQIDLGTNIHRTSISIANIFGQIVYSSTIDETPVSIHIAQPPGIYFLEILTSNNKYHSKVVVE